MVTAIRPQRVGGHGADVVPPHPVALEHRTVDAGPGHPGDAVVADHRQHAGHAHPDAAGHRLLDRHLARQPAGGGDARRPRAASASGRRRRPRRRRSARSRRAARRRPCRAGRASRRRCMTATAPAVRLASSSPKSRSCGAGAEQEVDPALRGPAARRPARTAAPSRSRRRPAGSAVGAAGSRNGRPSGPTMSSGSPGRTAGQPLGAAAVHAEDDLHGAAVRADRGGPVDRERPAQQQRRDRAADRRARRTGPAGTARRSRRP